MPPVPEIVMSAEPPKIHMAYQFTPGLATVKAPPSERDGELVQIAASFAFGATPPTQAAFVGQFRIGCGFYFDVNCIHDENQGAGIHRQMAKVCLRRKSQECNSQSGPRLPTADTCLPPITLLSPKLKTLTVMVPCVVKEPGLMGAFVISLALVTLEKFRLAPVLTSQRQRRWRPLVPSQGGYAHGAGIAHCGGTGAGISGF